MQSCIRPFGAVRCPLALMESGRSAPSQTHELDARTTPRVWPISGVTLFRHQIVVTLASWRPLSSWLGGRRFVDTLVPEQCPGDAGSLIGHGDQDNVCRPPFREPVGPAGTRARLCAAPAQHRSCTMHEQAPYVPIPALRYPPLLDSSRFALTLPFSGCAAGDTAMAVVLHLDDTGHG